MLIDAFLAQGSAKRWKKFVDSECPEKEKFPQEWKNKNSLQKLCMMRAFRPDRMTNAITCVLQICMYTSLCVCITWHWCAMIFSFFQIIC